MITLPKDDHASPPVRPQTALGGQTAWKGIPALGGQRYSAGIDDSSRRKIVMNKLAGITSCGLSSRPASSKIDKTKARVADKSSQNQSDASCYFISSPIRRNRVLIRRNDSRGDSTINIIDSKDNLQHQDPNSSRKVMSKSPKKFNILDSSIGDLMRNKWKNKKPPLRKDRGVYLSSELIHPTKVEAHLCIPRLPDSLSPDKKVYNIFRPNIKMQHYEPVSLETAAKLGMIAGSRNYRPSTALLQKSCNFVSNSNLINRGNKSIDVSREDGLKSLLKISSKLRSAEECPKQVKNLVFKSKPEISIDSGSCSPQRQSIDFSPVLSKESITLNTGKPQTIRPKSKFFIKNLVKLSELTKRCRSPSAAKE